MKIGITIPYASVNYSGGINVQCRMWRDGLRALGHDCILLTPWEKYDYNTFDYIIIIGIGKILMDYVKLFQQFDNLKLISAPVFDPNDQPLWKFKILCRYYGSRRLRMNKPLHDLYLCRNDFAFFLARSDFEKKYIVDALSVTEDRVKIVPISMRLDNVPPIDMSQKQKICLHVSRLTDKGKNVVRLIEAAKKYNFELRLAGTIHGEKERNWLDSLIGNSKNIKYIGWLSEDELKNEYKKAKVLALPSIIEGVGMVALEAAVCGCEICLTELGGPKEYYDGRAVLVNPYDIDSIGLGVLEAMNDKKAQPELGKYIMEKYSVTSCMERLQNFMKEY